MKSKNKKEKKETKIKTRKTRKIRKTRKTRNNKKKETKINKDYNPNKNFFIPSSRLNKAQRKYCHCLMNVRRESFRNPYGMCINILKSDNLVNYSKPDFKTLKKNKSQKKKYNKDQFNPNYTNCLLNYDLYKYNIRQIRLLAEEKDIKIYWINNGKKQFYKKNTLINKIIENYLNSKNKNKNESNNKKK